MLNGLSVTIFVAACFALMVVGLSLMVSQRRVATRTVFGDGDDKALRGRGRAFGNFSEYAPLMLIVLALVEGTGAPSVLVWFVGLVFLAARVLHAIGMAFKPSVALRGVAMMSQHLAFVVSAVWLFVCLPG